METTFLLNGETVRVADEAPTRTLLDWLRERRGLTGTKEGCNEGDCGACTVIVSDADGPRTLNACILFLPQLQGKAVHTVEGISGPDGSLHPVQAAMVAHHGSQCGFCTPGFIAAMACAHTRGETDHADQLAGNLCRCTGYAPILRAAEAAAEAPVPDWMAEPALPHVREDKNFKAVREDTSFNAVREDTTAGAEAGVDALWAQPRSSDALAAWYAEHPDATLVAGATDVGLWVTKQLRELAPIAFLNRCDDLKTIETTDTHWRLGAMVTISALLETVRAEHPSFAEMLRRYGSVQVRNAATLGGNIANGSPIGDSPPPLIALGAILHLRKGDGRREMPLEDFFLAYGKQDRAPGEFVEAITIPRGHDGLRVYKLSKRMDQDISAVCGAFNITLAEGRVTGARIAFGGMAGTPHRAKAVETALISAPWSLETVTAAAERMGDDYAPMSDMRASAAYRLRTAQNMLVRYFHETEGTRTDLREVAS
ncbi:xanthine dehydrogenase small subunit [Dinoroseobacter sp. PD6]|uniref:xanthine dehydrogenase small subunit n=1 Tax=Dinoroseobacter sp. PD6 TaxID=3028384 RepID=UPI00237BDC1F|nr:xanthine dehydrogenase small subunit [Dinoroseobacter sp. PD6]MDD9716866.1 xanthine dehydrogenase small subunit [Dinoroseobacter sp. PD6]